ncbi:hypothetical protein [Mesorhizobium sp. B2-6-2]|uniref:hypothetical protein n=1 Tax=Mesorhizobium sp. B2-6-2 TaxID=2589915 RepID=UPI00112D9C88|nr:hypothetical protein [Mesorhizobium sp. B2-6-2]TPJ82314.1 hypothetical protein FJ419_00585 [Mesorhizobium sp. B2-6-2]
MTGIAFARELESASDAIGDISRADLAIMLRRAAICLHAIVREWLETNPYLTVPYALDDESVTEGSA